MDGGATQTSIEFFFLSYWPQIAGCVLLVLLYALAVRLLSRWEGERPADASGTSMRGVEAPASKA